MTFDDKIRKLNLAIMQGDIPRSDFAESLIGQYRRWRRLSAKQWYWVDKLLADAEWSEDTAEFRPVSASTMLKAVKPQKAIGRTYFRVLEDGVRHVVWVPRGAFPPRGYERSS